MSLNFDIHAQSDLTCSDVDNGTVSYGLPSVLKLEPGRCINAVKTGVFIHDCSPSGTVHVTPTDAYADKLVFSDNVFGPSTVGVTFSITNTGKTFVRVEPTQLLCKYQFVPNPVRAPEQRQPQRTRSRSQLIVPVKVLQAVAAATASAPVAPVATISAINQAAPATAPPSAPQSAEPLSRAARRRARRQSVDLDETAVSPAEPTVPPSASPSLPSAPPTVEPTAPPPPARPNAPPTVEATPTTPPAAETTAASGSATEEYEQIKLSDILAGGDDNEESKEATDEQDESDDVQSSRSRRKNKQRITV